MQRPGSSHVTELAGTVPLEIGVGVCGRSPTQRVLRDQSIKRRAKKVVCGGHSK